MQPLALCASQGMHTHTVSENTHIPVATHTWKKGFQSMKGTTSSMGMSRITLVPSCCGLTGWLSGLVQSSFRARDRASERDRYLVRGRRGAQSKGRAQGWDGGATAPT